MRQLRPHLYFGPSVQPVELPRLRRTGITAVLSLQEPGPDLPAAAMDRMRAACAPGIRFVNVAIADYDPFALVERLPAALDALDELHRDGRVVYVHCSAGINRAPSLALAYLVRREGLAVDVALAALYAADAGVLPYDEVLHWLQRGTDAPARPRMGRAGAEEDG
ncbi:MAG: dual specificity protein phosphatase family protein [Candidatus Binatia bacterium]